MWRNIRFHISNGYYTNLTEIYNDKNMIFWYSRKHMKLDLCEVEKDVNTNTMILFHGHTLEKWIDKHEKVINDIEDQFHGYSFFDKISWI
jgi:hypothetical protein